ncbi:MAG: periplasmic heavy metal sensor [Bacteroidetes bacterium]|nr:periplasmic heavy metal sensor [Bacteroidota bacterium]
MDKQIKAYQYIIAGLVVINVLTISWQWFGPRKHPPRPEDILRKELQLTDSQMEAYRELIHEHRLIADPLEGDITDLRKQLLNYEVIGSSSQVIVDAIGKKQAEFEMSLYEHFKKVRALCNDKQQKKFDAVLLHALASGRPPRLRRD